MDGQPSYKMTEVYEPVLELDELSASDASFDAARARASLMARVPAIMARTPDYASAPAARPASPLAARDLRMACALLNDAE